ncbi:MAG TPA: hypothetical protein VFQ58_09245, partial [Flavisolibacter sp.]|nr:hypothetical protein [Flavisolibacter sp.]
MKKPILTALCTFLILYLQAAPVNKAIVSGLWGSNSTWSLNRIPASGDTVIIPFNYTVTIDYNVNMGSSTLYIEIFGSLYFSGGGAKLTLDGSSSIYVYPLGIILGQNNSSQKIKLGGSTVFQGSAAGVAGPQMATATTGGFIPFLPITLPVKFISFSLSRNNNDVLLQWSTGEESNSDRFDIERSTDGANWNTVGYVNAAGNSNNVINYSYTDRNNTNRISYYRIKQVDQNGSFVYTSVKSVNYLADSDIKISFLDNRVFVQFSK